MDVALNAKDPVKVARQPTNGHSNPTVTASWGRITSTTAFQFSVCFVYQYQLFVIFYTDYSFIVFFQKSEFCLVLQLTPKPRFYGQWGGN